jgi:hypothetical protein
MVPPETAMHGPYVNRKTLRDAKIACAENLTLQARSRYLARSRGPRKNILVSIFQKS